MEYQKQTSEKLEQIFEYISEQASHNPAVRQTVARKGQILYMENNKMKVFEDRKIRTAWDKEHEKWYFSVVDVVAVLTDSVDPKQYIKKMRSRDPELTIDRALATYLQKGYTREWINQRLQAIQVRKELTDKWQDRGVTGGKEYAILTNEITRAWSGMNTQQYKKLKGLKKQKGFNLTLQI